MKKLHWSVKNTYLRQQYNKQNRKIKNKQRNKTSSWSSPEGWMKTEGWNMELQIRNPHGKFPKLEGRPLRFATTKLHRLHTQLGLVQGYYWWNISSLWLWLLFCRLIFLLEYCHLHCVVVVLSHSLSLSLCSSFAPTLETIPWF